MTQPARPYRSPRRAQQAAETRAAVLDAARTSFAERGWAATGIRDVAKVAGVSVETVYGSVGAKAALFAAAYDGDPTPIAERPEFRAMGAGATLAERAAAAAALITGIHVRTLGLERALREGAASDPAMAELLALGDAQRRIDDERGMVLVLRRQMEKEEVDLFWALTSPETYDALVTRSGWSPDRYRAQVTQWILELGEAR